MTATLVLGFIDSAVRQVVRDAVSEGAADAPVLMERPRTDGITPPGGPATARPPGGNSSSSGVLTLALSATEVAKGRRRAAAEAIGFARHTTLLEWLCRRMRG